MLDYKDQQVILREVICLRMFILLFRKVNITLDEADKQFVTKLGANQIFGELG